MHTDIFKLSLEMSLENKSGSFSTSCFSFVTHKSIENEYSFELAFNSLSKSGCVFSGFGKFYS